MQTTARYAHLAADPILAAADQVSAEIAILLNDHATYLEGKALPTT